MQDQFACDTIGKWLADFGLADAPDGVRREAIRCWVDVHGCMLAGATTDVARKTRAVAAAEYAPGPCHVFGGEAASSASGAAMANAVAAHALDFDDTCYAGIVHGSAVVAPAVLAAAELAEADGETTLAAFVAGLEVAFTLGKALSNELYMKGWWATSVIGRLGAAAGAARALSLDAERAAHAMAIAALETNGLLAGIGTDAKPYLSGQAAAGGVTAALMASRGMTAPLNAFEDARGFAAVYNEGRFDSGMIERLGKDFCIEDPGIFFKPYPCCSAAHAALEAAEGLITENEIERGHITSILCEAPKLVDVSLKFQRPETVQQTQFSMPYVMACLLEFGQFGVEQLDAGLLTDAALSAAMENVRLHEDTALTAASTSGEVGPECARVIITTATGDRFEAFNSVATGAPAKPMSDRALDEKFAALAALSGHAARSDAWLHKLRHYHELSTPRDLWHAG